MNSSLLLRSSLRQMTRVGQNGLRTAIRPSFALSPLVGPSLRLMSSHMSSSRPVQQQNNRPSIVVAPRISSLITKFHTSSAVKNSEKGSESAVPSLSWNEFLALRIKRRKINVIASLVTTFAGILIGWGAVANVEIDPTALLYGFDPIKVLSVVLVVCGGLGYLAGPSLGAIIFKSSIRKQFGSFVSKDVEFLHHIKKNRPDPRSQSLANPVTDYYGEKIGSLKDYRQWLRDGRVYRKKTEKFL